MADPICVWNGNAICGEGPLWVAEENAVYWVDIGGLKIYRMHYETKEVSEWAMQEITSFILPRHNTSDFVIGC